MKDQYYLILRRFFFWFFLLGFLIFTPLIVSYSLGYKLDLQTHKLQKTGAISIKSSPKDVSVFIDHVKVADSTPFMSRELLPKRYNIVLQRENFYPYEITVDVHSAMVNELDVTLIPQMKNIQSLLPDLNVQKFFVISQLFGKKIIAFTNRGIYEMGESLENPQLLAPLPLEDVLIGSISGFKENKNQFIFWNPNRIWIINPLRSRDEQTSSVQLLYQDGEMIRDVYWGFKGRYLIVHDALKIFAMDVKNPQIRFPLFTLNSLLGSCYYDSDADVLYVKDRLTNGNGFSLFKISLMDLINEKKSN